MCVVNFVSPMLKQIFYNLKIRRLIVNVASYLTYRWRNAIAAYLQLRLSAELPTAQSVQLVNSTLENDYTKIMRN